MVSDPFKGAIHKGMKRGDMIQHPRLGKCTFYKHDLLRQRLEVFDQYGMLRYIPDREVPECQVQRNRES